MNAYRAELAALLAGTETKRPPALRRSLREDALYATDLPAAADEAVVASFCRRAQEAGWHPRREGGWIELDRAVTEPPEGALPDHPGPEAACCRSLMERHAPGSPADPRWTRRLIKAGEEGARAYEKACAAIHRDWAERLRKREGIPGISIAFFQIRL